MDHTDDIVIEGTPSRVGRSFSTIDMNGNSNPADRADTIAAFAHEMRTPLATIQATLELLSYEPVPRGNDLERSLARLQRSAAWMNTLIDNLSVWSKMAEKPKSFVRSPTSVRDWIEQAMTLVQPIVEKREQTILFACPEPPPVVVGDEFRLSQVMVNLLTNASRYGAWADTISITVIDEGDAVVVRVSDHGRGIPDDECKEIFSPGVRGREAISSTTDGQGLGLHIVTNIILCHGGTVGVDSVLGRGTTFWIRLPCSLLHGIEPWSLEIHETSVEKLEKGQ